MNALQSLFEFSVDMTRFDEPRGSLVDFLVDFLSVHSDSERFQKGSESKTWSPLIERIKKKNPVFEFFWNKVDKPPMWKRSTPEYYKKVLNDYNDKVKSRVDAQPLKTTYAHPSKITSPVVRKASLKLSHW